MSEIGSEDSRLKQQLRSLVQAVEAAGRATLLVPDDALLRSIVEAAARIFGAAAASILLLDESQKFLVFMVSTGAADHNLAGMRFPINQGIAGYVVMTGQPIAISNVEQDARFNREFAKSTGYVPRSILAMPLTSGERILGVMEVLDKIDAPAFGMQDMDLLAIFARQAALAIEQSQGMARLGEALAAGLQRLAQTAGVDPDDELLSAIRDGEDDLARNELLELALLLGEFNRQGEEERKTGMKILAAFADYSQSKRRISRGEGRR